MNPAVNTVFLQKEFAFAHTLKNYTKKILEIINPGHQLAETNLNLLAEQIFKYLSNNQSTLDLKDLKAVSSLIYRHTTAYNKIKSLELKTFKLLKEQRLELNLHDLQPPADVNSTPDTTPEIPNHENIAPPETFPIDIPFPSMASLNTSPQSLSPSTPTKTISQNISPIKNSQLSSENIVVKHGLSAFSSYFHNPIELKDLFRKKLPELPLNKKLFSPEMLKLLLTNPKHSNYYQSTCRINTKSK